jgi:beta-lactam-binding protein with PASTA domain
MLRSIAIVLGCTFALAASACGSARPRAVPDVTGKRLDVAEDTLDALGLHYRTAGGGAFGIVVRSHWYVCEQRPAPRKVARNVLLTVERSCTVPDVVGESLEDAEDDLRRAGIDFSVDSLDGDPVVVDSFWTVCDQSPPAGAAPQTVRLEVARDDDWCEYDS